MAQLRIENFTRSLLGSIAAIMLVTSMSGCATVLSERRYPVTIDNAEGPTFFSVHDRKNQVIHQGVTPQQVTLDAKAFPYWPARYSVAFAGVQSTTQVQEVKAKLDPWSAGNLLLGGVPGFAVDGATGAMFKLPKKVSGTVPTQFAVTDTTQGSQLVATAMPPSTPAANPNFLQGGVLAPEPQTMQGSPEVQMASASGPTTSPDDVVTR